MAWTEAASFFALASFWWPSLSSFSTRNLILRSFTCPLTNGCILGFGPSSSSVAALAARFSALAVRFFMRLSALICFLSSLRLGAEAASTHGATC